MPLLARRFLPLLLTLTLLAGCAAPREGEEKGEPRKRAPRRAAPAVRPVEIALARQADEAQTVQLYAGAAEDRLPIIRLGSNEIITLEFDLMARAGRPLSVYFYHADRRWQRDLMPSEYMDSFHRDGLLNFRASFASSIPYTHYRYTFPNNAIDFRISGNYILRVTEQGDEEAVLFERPFFITEQTVPIDMRLERMMAGGYGFPAVSPVLQFTPQASEGSSVYDYDVCFVRNGALANTRCSEQPSLIAQPSLQFYLRPEAAFSQAGGEYYLDLSDIRVTDDVEATRMDTNPYTVLLKPDYAQFPAGGIDPVLNGQTVVAGSVRSVADPDHGGEYVTAQFSFVPPDEAPLGSEVLLLGSFNGWDVATATRLVWTPENGRYEGERLLKQGEYEYRYISRDGRLQALQASAPPRSEAQYIGFVYYSDLRVHTDRIVGVAAGIMD